MAKLGKSRKTDRGFGVIDFKDYYGKECSIQESPLAVCKDKNGKVENPLGWILLGIDSPNPIIMKSKALEIGLKLPPGEVSGWMDYPTPEDVSIATQMHLNEHQVRGLIGRLQDWLETGEVK